MRLGVTLLMDLHDALEGWSDPVVLGVAHDGAVLVLARRPSSTATQQERRGGAPKNMLETSLVNLVIRIDETEARPTTISDLPIFVHSVQPFGAGLLLVGTERPQHAEGRRENAVIVDPTGNIIRRLALGHGIADVRTSAEGDIWVSYIDEVVYAMLGPDGLYSDSGAAGLVRFDSSGTPTFTYDPKVAGTGMIDDAYAFNLATDGTAWVYFYSEFPIVSIRDGVYRRYEYGKGGARAFAVREDRALLVGAYRDPDLVRIVSLEPDKASVVDEARLHDGAGGCLGQCSTYGRGDRLYFLKDRRVFTLADW